MNLGKKIEPPAPEPRPEWVAADRLGFERNTSTGALRTVLPLPPAAPPSSVDVDIGFLVI